MPVLPVMDLLILVGWTSLSIGAVLKAIYVSTSYRPTFLGLTPLDLLLVAGCSLLFAVALAARTWVRANEPGLLAARRRLAQVQDLQGSPAPPETAGEHVSPAPHRAREAMTTLGGR